MTRRYLISLMLAVFASAALILAASYSFGERKADADRRRALRCKPIAVSYEVTMRPEFIKAVQDCFDRAEERRERRWGPWNAWGGNED